MKMATVEDFLGGIIIISCKKKRKSFLVIGLCMIIMLTFSSCSFNDIKQIGLSILTGTPIKSDDSKTVTEETIDNQNNYYIKDDETSEAAFKYTVEQSYQINGLSEANISLEDFPDSDERTRYFTSDGKLLDKNMQLVCIDFCVEKQSERKKSFIGATDENIHILPNMQLFAENFTNRISEPFYAVYLEETKDIKRSTEDREYFYYSLKKGQTARFKFCYIVNKSKLKSSDIGIDLGESVTINGANMIKKRCYIPITIKEGK